TPPTVSGSTPSNGATNVPLTSPASIIFSETMDQASAQSAFSPSPNVSGAFSWNATSTTMTFTPSAPLATSTTYTLTESTGARDLAGNPLLSATTWSFTTAAAPPPPPTVTGLNPTVGTIDGGTQVTISGSGFTGATAVTFGGV